MKRLKLLTAPPIWIDGRTAIPAGVACLYGMCIPCGSLKQFEVILVATLLDSASFALLDLEGEYWTTGK